MNKPFENMAKCARKTKRAEVATNELSALDITQPVREVTHMPFEHDMGQPGSTFKDKFQRDWSAV